MVFEKSYSQKTISIDSINKLIFKSDLSRVYKNSTYKNKVQLKEKLDSIQKIKLMYHIDTDSLHAYETNSQISPKDSISQLKTITKAYRLSPKYCRFFKEGHSISISYETYIDKNCNAFSLNCKESDHKLTDIKIINNYEKRDFDLNKYLEVFFNTDEKHECTTYIISKEKQLVCSYNELGRIKNKFVKSLNKLDYIKETDYRLNEEPNIYLILFTKIHKTNDFLSNKEKKYFKIYFNPLKEKIIINIGPKFYIAKNSKIDELKNWGLEQFNIK